MKIDYTLLSGGLDLVSGSVSVKPGRVSDCLNFEQVFGEQGYRRIDGYERFDGRPEPHKARYWTQKFKDGGSAPTVGDALTGLGVSGTLLELTLESGDWGAGTAAGGLVVALDDAGWVDGTSIYVGATLIALADGESVLGRAANSADHKRLLRLAVNSRRAVIANPVGSGPVRGLAVYRDWVVALRDVADGSSATLWRSSASGWVAIRTGLLPGGRMDATVANFSGDSKKTALYGCDGRNVPFVWDGATYTEIAPFFGTQATSLSSVAIGMGSKSFTIVEAARGWTPGDLLTIYSSADGFNRMSGSVTSYSGSSLVVNITVTGGTGTFTDWRIGQADFEDKPYLVTAHKDHLFFALPRGQLQTSNLGDPLVYTTTAASFGVGEEITGLSSLKGAQLGVFCDNKVHLLEGTSTLDWQLSLHAQNIGTKLYTVQENAGNALMLGARGMVSLQATQSFGGFEPAIFSRDVKPLLDKRMPDVVCTRIVRGKYQYRMYFTGGRVLTATILSPNPVVAPSDVAFMAQEYAHSVSCVASGLLGVEDAILFGTEDGWVMREDVGTSFDGEAIDAILRIHFNHIKSPVQKKRYHKLTLEMQSPDAVDIHFKQAFDFSDGMYPTSINREASTPGSGGQWDASEWNDFYWSLPLATQAEANIDGVGRNMGLLLWTSSDSDQPMVLQGLILQYAPLGMTR